MNLGIVNIFQKYDCINEIYDKLTDMSKIDINDIQLGPLVANNIRTFKFFEDKKEIIKNKKEKNVLKIDDN